MRSISLVSSLMNHLNLPLVDSSCACMLNPQNEKAHCQYHTSSCVNIMAVYHTLFVLRSSLWSKSLIFL